MTFAQFYVLNAVGYCYFSTDRSTKENKKTKYIFMSKDNKQRNKTLHPSFRQSIPTRHSWEIISISLMGPMRPVRSWSLFTIVTPITNDRIMNKRNAGMPCKFIVEWGSRTLKTRRDTGDDWLVLYSMPKTVKHWIKNGKSKSKTNFQNYGAFNFSNILEDRLNAVREKLFMYSSGHQLLT